VALDFDHAASSFVISIPEAREIMHDMAEAVALSKGDEAVSCMAEEVRELDTLIVGGQRMIVTSTLSQSDGWVLQFEGDYTEIVLPPDTQLTVWRTIE
jgi:hypothetical protein